MSVGSAVAATEVGSRCEADTLLITGNEGIVFPLPSSTTPLPDATEKGVATQWIARSQSSNTFYQRLKVVHTTTGTNMLPIVAEAPPQPIVHGSGPFPIRIPVQAGDRFGLSGVGGGVLACNTGASTDILGTTLANGQVGQSEPFYPISGYQLALTVMVEPDADGDGYGDESQDGCPESDLVQVPCPAVALSPKAEVKKYAILVQIKVSSEAQVQVSGQVNWQSRSKRGRDIVVGLKGGKGRTVGNSGATFRLPLRRSIKRRLEQLLPSRALRARLTVQVTDLAGRTSKRRLLVLLPGRG